MDIDQQSLERYGRWPWKRANVARLVDALAAAQPRAIGVGILFAERSDEVNDRTLSVAINRAKNAVLGYVKSPGPVYPVFYREAPREGRGFDIGFLEFEFDNRGRAVGVRPVVYQSGVQHRAFAIVLAEKLGNSRGEKTTETAAMLRVNFYGAKGTLRHVSAATVLSEKRIEQLEGKIVIVDVDVGVIYTETPVGPMRDGEIHASIVQNIVDGSWLRFHWLLNLALCALGGIAVGGLQMRRIALPMLIGTYVAASYLIFLPRGLVTSTLSFITVLLLSYLCGRRLRLRELSGRSSDGQEPESLLS